MNFNNDKNINTVDNWDNVLYGKQISMRKWKEAGINYMKTIIPYCKIEEPQTSSKIILDFGCGLGYGVEILCKAFPSAHIIGMDHSKSALEFCSKTHGKIAEFLNADQLLLIPHIDIMICSHVVEHIDDDTAFIQEMRKKCSHLLVAVPYREPPGLEPYHVHVYNENSFNTIDGFENAYVVNYYSHNFLQRIEAILKDSIKFFIGRPIRKRAHIIFSFKGYRK